jgi:uncharacterized protein (TIGR00255 family)
MALSSMTGFARASGATGKLQWLWDVKSVNGKALEIRLRLPPGLDYLETQARVILGQMFKRGNLQASLTLSATSQVAPVRINEAVLEEYLAIAEKLKARLGATTLQPEALLGLRGVAEQVEAPTDEKEINERDSALLETLTAAAKDLMKARRDEGARLRKVLEAQIERIGVLMNEAKANPSRKPDAIRARLAEQVKKLMDANSTFDSDRLHQEAALLATRFDIQEELDRLESHLGAARDLMKSSEPVGRKFDFLTQEFNREVNTLCSKSNDVALTSVGLELKAVVDQLREQIQNIE